MNPNFIHPNTQSQQDHLNLLNGNRNAYEARLLQNFNSLSEKEVKDRMQKVLQVIDYMKAEQQLKSEWLSNMEYVYILSKNWKSKWQRSRGYEQIQKSQIIAWQLHDKKDELIDMNIDLLQKQNTSTLKFTDQHNAIYNNNLRIGLDLGLDYIYLNQKMWDIVSKYKNCVEIKRMVIEENMSKEVQLYFLKIKIVIISNRIIDNVYLKRKVSLPIQRVNYSKYKNGAQFKMAFNQLILQAISSQGLHEISQHTNSIKLWILQPSTQVLPSTKIQPPTQIQNFKQRISKSVQNQSSIKQFSICINGIQLKQEEMLNCQLIYDQNILVCQVIESQSKAKGILYNQNDHLNGVCPRCMDTHILSQICACFLVTYCSEKCRKQDAQHLKRCPSKIINHTPINSFEKGVLGLPNIGNSCYMNSSLQCLFNIPELAKLSPPLRVVSPSSTNLVQAYKKVHDQISKGSINIQRIYDFKAALIKYERMYQGNKQHDAGQFINHVLTAMLQDQCGNALQVKKQQSNQSENNNQPVEEFKKLCELIHGDYQSELVCLNCNNKSIQVSQFSQLFLPIPLAMNGNKQQSIQLLIQEDNSVEKQMMLGIEQNQRMQELVQKIRNRLQKQHARRCVITSSKSKVLLSDTVKQVKNKYKDKIYVRFTFEQQRQDQPQQKLRQPEIFVFVSFKFDEAQSIKKELTEKMFIFGKQTQFKSIHNFLYKHHRNLYDVGDYEKMLELGQQLIKISKVASTFMETCWNCNKKCKGCSLPYNQQTLGSIGKSKIYLEYYLKSKLNIQQFVRPANTNQQTSISLIDCFKTFQQPQILCKDNAWFCVKCDKKVTAKKQIKITKVPQILIICLKRFINKGSSCYKNTNQVKFPIKDLDLTDFILNPDPQPKTSLTEQLPQNSLQMNKQNGAITTKPLYDLFGICCHSGSFQQGHYTAKCRNFNTDKWNVFNDLNVASVGQTKIEDKNAYILFYRKKV